MRNVLSQAEIDSLLQSLESGELDTEELKQEQQRVRKYDFRRPNRFSKANMSLLSLIHDNFSRQIANFLSAYLRASVSAKVASVDQVTFEDVVVSLPSNTISSIFTIVERGFGVLQGGSDIILPMIDLVCGGSGEPMKSARSMTDIETAIFARLTRYMLERYELAWQDHGKVQCQFENIESNPRLIQAVSPDEMVAVMTISIQINKVKGILTICLPFGTINTLLNRSAVAEELADEVSLQERWSARQGLLGHSLLEMAAILGETDLSVKDFLRLQVGDVIAVGRKPGDPLELTIEGQGAFLALPGLSGNQLGVQIVSPLGSEED